jgi:hypothetical protein
MYPNKISFPEKLVLAAVVLVIAVGFLLFYTDYALYTAYTTEDALVEWLTVLGLLMGAYVCFGRAFRIATSKGVLFLVTALVMGGVLFLAAGEEISWGQRLFGIESPEYFKKNNTQAETNIHNLIVGGVRINRWIFSFLLTAVLAFYLIILPVLYRKKRWAQRLVQFWGVPLPKTYQTVFTVLLFALVTQLMDDPDEWELLECGTAFLLFLVIAFPVNKGDFTRAAPPAPEEERPRTRVSH